MTAVKWAIFVTALLASFSSGRWLRERPTVRIQLWTLVGAMPILAPRLFMSIVFFGPLPTADTTGVEVALIDWLALSLLLAAKPTDRPLPYRFPLFAFFLITVVSVAQARWTFLAVTNVWQLGRMYLLFLAVWRGGNDDKRVPAALLRGMAFGVVCASLLAVWQHYGLERLRATGTFDHPNILGGMVNLVVMVPIARILSGRTSLLMKLAPVAAVIADFLTVSRGTLLFLGLGAALVFVGSVLREATSRKAWFGLLGAVTVAAMVPMALSTIESRTAEERALSMDGRRELDEAASLMLHDHPLGVGPTHYAVELLLGGYGERARVYWGMRTNLVHNIYWLVAAELGYAGLAALLLLFVAPLITAFRHGLRRGRERQRDVLLGLGVALTVFYLHCLYESLWRRTEVTYLYFILAAMIPVLAMQLRSAHSSTRTAHASAGPHRARASNLPMLTPASKGRPAAWAGKSAL